jgi:NhaP-type Na+/H+ or K+/H+ antiporter/Trk K+ transport system NAD-binding subunit
MQAFVAGVGENTTAASAHNLLIMMGLVIAVSIATQLIAARLRMPSIVPLLAVGVLMGPEVLNLVNPDALGDGLRVIIPLMVAIIVFEGGMALDLTYLRQVSRAVQNLVAVGSLITAALAATCAVVFVGFSWPLALLFGALVSVTGPTVINPLMRRAAVKQRLKTILMAEGVLVDAVGAVLAVVVLEALLTGQPFLEGVGSWGITVGGGTCIGVIGGWLLGKGLDLVGRELTAELTRLSALGGALAIYTLAEVFSSEAGIAAAAVAGIVVGNMRFPHEEPVHHFKGDLTTLGLGVIFVLLAARLQFADLTALGWGGVATVVILMLLVRPACVFLATFNTKLNLQEKLFISAVGPRGIVSASFATFAALRLEDAGYANSDLLTGLVFMVIIGTVVIQGFTTPWIAKLLGVQPMLTLIIGADPLGRDLGYHLQKQGEEVTLVDRNVEHAARAREKGLTVVQGDATDESVLRRAGIERARALVATTASDKTNLLVCQIAKSRFGLIELVSRANDGANIKAFTDLGIRAMSPNTVAVMVLDNLLRRPSTLRLLTDLDPGKEVREIVLYNNNLAGKAIKDISLDGDVLISTIRRDGKLFVPHGSTLLALGDQITFIGTRDDVHAVAGLFESYMEPDQQPTHTAA